MGRILYAMQFKGQAAPADDSGTVLTARMTAASCTFNTAVGPDGVNGTLQPEQGGAARFESEVTLLGESTFREAGTIAFGDGGHSLRFSTMGEGHIGPSAEPDLKQGAVIWRIDGGEGQFEGATGLITSNFWLTRKGEVVDNQLGVIFVE